MNSHKVLSNILSPSKLNSAAKDESRKFHTCETDYVFQTPTKSSVTKISSSNLQLESILKKERIKSDKFREKKNLEHIQLSGIIPKIILNTEISKSKETINMFFKTESQNFSQLKKQNRVQKEIYETRKFNKSALQDRKSQQYMNSKIASKKKGAMLINELWSQNYYKKIMVNAEILEKTRKLEKIKRGNKESNQERFDSAFKKMVKDDIRFADIKEIMHDAEATEGTKKKRMSVSRPLEYYDKPAYYLTLYTRKRRSEKRITTSTAVLDHDNFSKPCSKGKSELISDSQKIIDDCNGYLNSAKALDSFIKGINTETSERKTAKKITKIVEENKKTQYMLNLKRKRSLNSVQNIK